MRDTQCFLGLLQLRDFLAVAEDVGNLAGVVEDRAERAHVVTALFALVDPQLFEGNGPLGVDHGLDGPLAPLRDGHGVLSLSAPIVMRFSQNPLAGSRIPDPGGRVE